MPKHLQRQIEQLKQKILFVGSMVEGAIANAVAALVHRDEAIARKVLEEDAEIDRMEVDVEEDCLKILALYQPVAIDLRFVVAVLKINNDLERMGDLAKNIAKRVLFLSRVDRVDVPVDFRGMAIRAQDMVKRSLDALVGADSSLAHRVRQDDDELDNMRRAIHEKIRAAIRAKPEQTETLMKLYSVAKHLERLGDMATNVAEDVIYMVEGDIVRHQGEE
ncbi:MAG TPA: phosphate signaling complex protein PhoU [Pirellulales bacterium]|jgi:phosphate transport system protein|nr:phosphate signaling complex protein PhoU [Pirellulales bacterium]